MAVPSKLRWRMTTDPNVLEQFLAAMPAMTSAVIDTDDATSCVFHAVRTCSLLVSLEMFIWGPRSAPALQVLAESLPACQQLRKLSLQQLVLPFYKNANHLQLLKSVVAAASQLTELHLVNCTLGSLTPPTTDLTLLWQAVPQTVTILNLEGSGLSANCLQTLVPLMSQLTSLDLSYNHLQGNDVAALLASTGTPRLTELWLKSSAMRLGDMQSFFHALGRFSQLAVLSLACNLLTVVDIRALSTFLLQCPSLKKLFVDGTALNEDSRRLLLPACRHLTLLSFHWNTLAASDAPFVQALLQQNRDLQLDVGPVQTAQVVMNMIRERRRLIPERGKLLIAVAANARRPQLLPKMDTLLWRMIEKDYF